MDEQQVGNFCACFLFILQQRFNEIIEMTLSSINPFTHEKIRDFEEFSDEKSAEILLRSLEAFDRWKRTTFEYRSSLMLKTAIFLRTNISEYASSITNEMGKPIRESLAEVEKCAWVCEYYAENAEAFLADEPAVTDADSSYVRYEPLGPILGIMPWNFPFWQVFRFAVPTLMAGNTVLLKHASNVQLCARNIENIFSGAGFPPFVFGNLVIGSARVDNLLRNEAIRAVSLTGSEAAGQKVAETAGRMLKKTVLELGGSNAFIVLDDADIKAAAETGIKARFQNAGQSCIAAKRFIITEKIYSEFLDLFLKKMSTLKSGDPSLEETDIGPLATVQQAERVEAQVKKSVEAGAKLIRGGGHQKAFFEPTLVTGVVPGMPLFDEEIFGPVAAVTIAKDTEAAVSLANHSGFGLGVSLFTRDLDRAQNLIGEFQDGAVFINSMVKSDPRLPFGGTRNSGYGRELARQGIREFVNVKTVYLKK
jgi:succinate-semialdehyde dehydrogenase / glutarate-semialdehyde dehydrogenase